MVEREESACSWGLMLLITVAASMKASKTEGEVRAIMPPAAIASRG